MGSHQKEVRMSPFLAGILASLALFRPGLSLHDSVINVESFDGFQVYRTQPLNKEEADYLQDLRQHRDHYDFWTEVRTGHGVDIMVPPGMQAQLEEDLKMMNLKHEVIIPDVQRLIELEKVPAVNKDTKQNTKHAMSWTEYHSLEDMYTYLDYLEETYDFVTTEEIGQSYEGRAMRVAKVCKGGCGNKSAVWIDGGIHAREWITPAAVTWMLGELVEGTSGADLLDSLDFHILPSHNPDGYAYSREHDRMRRKTRSDNGGSCKGVDPNRNWGFKWSLIGSSSNKCSNKYHGPSPFSEIEVVNVRDYLLGLN